MPPSRLDVFRNRMTLALDAKDSEFQKKVLEQYDDIKSEITDDGYWWHAVGTVIQFTKLRKDAAKVNGFFNTKHFRTSCIGAVRTGMVRDFSITLLHGLQELSLLDKGAPEFKHGADLYNKELKKGHEAWNIAAGVKLAKTLYDDAKAEIAYATKDKKTIQETLKGEGELRGMNPRIFAAAYQSDIFGKGKLTEEERYVADDYKDSGHRSLNNHLRKPSRLAQPKFVARMEDQTKRMDSAIAKFKIKRPVQVHRGMSLGTLTDYNSFLEKFGGKLTPGAVIQDAGFVSTTTHNDVLSNFIIGSDKVHIKMEIALPAGANAMPIGLAATDESRDAECELVLPRDSKFQIEEVSDEADPTGEADARLIIMKLKLVPKTDTETTAAEKPIKPKVKPAKAKPAKVSRFMSDTDATMSLKVLKMSKSIKGAGKP